MPRAASLPPTWAVALPLPIGPRTRLELALELSSSPGSTIRLKRTSSIPAKSASLPRFSSSREHGDRAGLRHRLDDQHAGHDRAGPGKWPARYHSSGRTVLRATTRSPGSSSSTSSIRRNGSRCGRIASISSRPSGHAARDRVRTSRARKPLRGPGARSTSRFRPASPSRTEISSNEKPSASLRTTTLACSCERPARPAPSSCAELGERCLPGRIARRLRRARRRAAARSGARAGARRRRGRC